MERALLRRLVRFLGIALGSSDVFALQSWGSYETRSALALNLAILMRSAPVTRYGL